MVSIVQTYMEIEGFRSYLDELYSPDPEKCLSAVLSLKNSVIGSNRQKGNMIAQGVVTRLMQILGDIGLKAELRTEAAFTLGSLAKGSEAHVGELIKIGVVPLLLDSILTSEDSKLTEACLRCSCSIFKHPTVPVELVFQNRQLVSHLLQLAMNSVPSQICVMTILAASCKSQDNQNILNDEGAVSLIASLLCSPHYAVIMPTLHCLANLCYQNPNIAAIVSTTSYGGKSIPDLLVPLMSRDQPSDTQLAAAKCATNLHRAHALSAEDPRILYKALPVLVCLCKKECKWEERVKAAETLAFLTEVDTQLQQLASISNHLIPTLAEFLHYRPETSNSSLSPSDHDHIARELKQAAFRAFSSLGANDEDIRKKIIETDSIMKHIVSGLQDSYLKVRLAAIRCLHSLSRSVQQLRTTFQDHSVWRPLMNLLQHATDDILTVSVASSTLCNLLLEFSPSKEPILESGAVDLLCSLTKRDDPALRLNGVWALMNMAFQADQKIKLQILHTLGTDQLFRLLSDSEVNIIMKTLGLLRNLLSTKPHIDHIMGLCGSQIMQAVILILEGNHSVEVKEQALCILANIGDGITAKDYIMANEDVLKKLQDYMLHSNEKLQIAAIFCISNLVWKEDSGSAERQAKLKEMGIYALLQQLIITSDALLFDKVKTAMTQFSDA
ncbi:unnamed protein product [Bemisia tabaci]|uniref:Armadillo repeat-containing protein 8 n=1 Tax=Bemisia tabaci TaxID=7038 RepID=A0A9P0AAN2_BEMTA|nr:PREDICTED: armadillo repeat-containing protein 8-like [Bemisia tabaci]CAH0390272.1 unnamed protein product [Bemisia tabaci]